VFWTALICVFVVAFKGIRRWRDLFFSLVGVLAVFLCRSTTAYLLLAVCVSFLLVLSIFQPGKFQKLFLLLPFFLIVGLVLLPRVMTNDYVLYNLGKIVDFFHNQEGKGSGYVRSSVILFNINVFLARPVFGAGIASCDCHGILFGLLSNIGILGLLSYIVFLMYCAGFHFSFLSTILVIVFIGFSCGCYTLSDAISPFFFCIFLSCYSLDSKSFKYKSGVPFSCLVSVWLISTFCRWNRIDYVYFLMDKESEGLSSRSLESTFRNYELIYCFVRFLSLPFPEAGFSLI